METVPAQNKIVSMLRQRQQAISLLEALRVIRTASNDHRIRGLILDLSTAGSGSSPSSLGFGQIQELREAIKEFAEKKKAAFGSKAITMAMTDSFESQMLYYLATACDEVRMEPSGSLPLVGLHIVQPFFKKVLDKVGIVFRSYALGPYKSVNGTFTEPEGWTPLQRENLTTTLSELNDQLIQGIEASRSLAIASRLSKSPESVKDILDAVAAATTKPEGFSISDLKVKDLTDIAPLSADECFHLGLVDKLAFKLSPFRKEVGSDAKADQRVKGLKTISFEKYKAGRDLEKSNTTDIIIQLGDPGAEKPQPTGKTPATVGLVYMVGTIMRGDGPFGSNTVARAIVDAARDKDVDAVVFRIDSGGGDVVATETIWDAVRVAQTLLKKPVVASYGNVSASGGYYASSSCDKILCSPGTITGSIGVAAAKPHVTSKFFDLVGELHVDEIAFSEGVKNLSIIHDIGGDDNETAAWKRFRKMTEAIYRVFKNRVMEGRAISKERIDDVAGGRVWSGASAKEIGLVDELGGIKRAISVAAQLGLISKYGSPEKASAKVSEWARAKAAEEALVNAPSPKNLPKASLESLEMDDHVQIQVFPKPKPLLKRLREGDALETVLTDLSSEVSASLWIWLEGLVKDKIQERREALELDPLSIHVQ
ncbi:hypothetical protein HDU97_009445 [Phlyctochytrium planicorne]|nr:hypothetical protein HDU97_009445 [Phlyctochytrium planicorne]